MGFRTRKHGSEKQKGKKFELKESGDSKDLAYQLDSNLAKENSEEELLEFAKGKSDDADNEVKENAKEHDVSVPVIDTLREQEKDDSVLIEKIDDGFNTVSETGRYIELTNGATYNLYKDYDQMENEARARIKEDLENEPEIFNKDFLDSHMEISETDARMFGVDAGNFAVEDRDLEELKDMAKDNNIDFDDDEDEDKLLSKLQDEISSKIADDVEETIKKNGLRYYIVDQEGFCSDEEFMEQYGKWLRVDIDSAVDDAISADGVEHFISSYDGESHETSDGQYLVKHND